MMEAFEHFGEAAVAEVSVSAAPSRRANSDSDEPKSAAEQREPPPAHNQPRRRPKERRGAVLALSWQAPLLCWALGTRSNRRMDDHKPRNVSRKVSNQIIPAS